MSARSQAVTRSTPSPHAGSHSSGPSTQPSLPGGMVPAHLLQSISAYDLYVFLHGYKPAAAEWQDLLYSMFLHGGFMHLGGNMLYLWIFGNNIEDAMGHGRFIVFYLICGVAAVFAQALPDPESTIPMIGASGAISGVLGAYLLLFPHARVLVAIPIGFYIHTMSLKAGIVLMIWFGLQIFSSLAAGDGPGVAWFAHIGGFVAGVVLIPLFKYPHVRLLAPARTGGRWHRRGRRR